MIIWKEKIVEDTRAYILDRSRSYYSHYGHIRVMFEHVTPGSNESFLGMVLGLKGAIWTFIILQGTMAYSYWPNMFANLLLIYCVFTINRSIYLCNLMMAFVFPVRYLATSPWFQSKALKFNINMLNTIYRNIPLGVLSFTSSQCLERKK